MALAGLRPPDAAVLPLAQAVRELGGRGRAGDELLDTGLSREVATERLRRGRNELTPPIDCPAWLCCLLPCLARTEAMRRFRAALPREALVRREHEDVLVSATDVVVGDVLLLAPGDVLPADVLLARSPRRRAVEVEMDWSPVLGLDGDGGSDGRGRGVGDTLRQHRRLDRDGVDERPRYAPAGAVLVRSRIRGDVDEDARSGGEARGGGGAGGSGEAGDARRRRNEGEDEEVLALVIATGEDTLWSRLTRRGLWPLQQNHPDHVAWRARFLDSQQLETAEEDSVV